MTHKSEVIFNKELYDGLKIDCEKCFGFCCIALYFSASEGFPADKDAGKPCLNLQSDFSCAIHKNLRKKGLKGCTSYDCFGAGQKVAQGTYRGHNWKQTPEAAKEMFEVFLIMRQLHEMLWYLSEAFRIQSNDSIQNKLKDLIDEVGNITNHNPDSLMKLDIEAYRDRVNLLLHQTSETVRTKALNGQRSTLKRKKIAGRLDCFGADLRKSNLRGADLRGAFLIAADLRGNDLSGADFIGADMRDADLRGTNLEESIFLTQGQINTAKGDSNTKLPPALMIPTYWEK
ncbi:pentapeptide repeat-containing protein [Clostridium sp. BL-8]|uniref:pentapeptide repeat-containing protein n=1 Tax=Clostridium sp. BL-8 TaxID=349938 RepID=UPI00098BF239|nr:pentapeptide repeat-containing protein [Clostridium sp. BL-8]OOM81291.1 pentapeptide repeat protein [Clostridium sp. BL-8]